MDEDLADQRKRSWEELKSLYGWCVSELAEFKGRQWQVIANLLAVFAALAYLRTGVTLPQEFGELFLKRFLLVLSTVALFIGWGVVVNLSYSMELRRKRMRDVRKHLSPKFMQAWEPDPKEPSGKEATTWVFETVMFTGWGLLFLYIFRAAGACAGGVAGVS